MFKARRESSRETLFSRSIDRNCRIAFQSRLTVASLNSLFPLRTRKFSACRDFGQTHHGWCSVISVEFPGSGSVSHMLSIDLTEVSPRRRRVALICLANVHGHRVLGIAAAFWLLTTSDVPAQFTLPGSAPSGANTSVTQPVPLTASPATGLPASNLQLGKQLSTDVRSAITKRDFANGHSEVPATQSARTKHARADAGRSTASTRSANGRRRFQIAVGIARTDCRSSCQTTRENLFGETDWVSHAERSRRKKNVKPCV